MSFPNIPDVHPDIDLKRHDVINLLLASIAFEELGLAHLINAEGEKLQKILKIACEFEEIMEANKSVERMLRTIIKKEMLLLFKLEDVLDVDHDDDEHKHHHHHDDDCEDDDDDCDDDEDDDEDEDDDDDDDEDDDDDDEDDD